MKAIVQDRYGSADVLEFRDVPRPVAGEDDVLVHVVAAGVDRGAWHSMTGQPFLMRLLGFGLRAPRSPVPGRNIAGRVESAGDRVTGFRPGDEVYGTTEGAYAEYARAAVGKIAPKPRNLSFAQAAVTPYAGFAALQALRDVGRLTPGEDVLIVGASGAVGSATIQLAKAFGARVTAVCSGANTDFVLDLGADEVIDYTVGDFSRGAERFDLVVDIGGRTSVARLRRRLRPHGRLVIIGGEGDRWIGGIQRQLWAVVVSFCVRQRLSSFVARENARDLLELNKLIEAGQFEPHVARMYPLAEAADAMRQLDVAHHRGRIAVTV